MADRSRLIAHLDMDAFYASVELLRYPELAGQPVVIGGGGQNAPREAVDATSGKVTRTFSTLRDYRGRGVITTATYAARAYGLHSAQGMMKAAALAPDAIVLPADFDEYRRYSRRFKSAVAAIAPHIEDRGIDEIYVDLTGLVDARGPLAEDARFDAARTLAQSIKDAVRRATALSCSIAVAPNKLLAKIASELDKPDGLTIIRPQDVAARIWPLPARRINGIGPKSADKLDALGVRTIGELAAADPIWLCERFGRSQGAWMHDAANGRDARVVETVSEPRSISRETTFDRDLHVKRDRAELADIFTHLCESLAGDLARKGYVTRTIGIKLRFDDFSTVTRDRTIEAPTQDAATIRDAAGRCLARVTFTRRMRLLGVRAGGLARADAAAAQAPRVREPTLFD
ncbi:MAG TPA: DNA polymerase IV [Casimicrobiaceae bacterium]|jgi:DNA polymerase-4|nr:DNA polymerase IV [Casimicrobiaceae bacterium]